MTDQMNTGTTNTGTTNTGTTENALKLAPEELEQMLRIHQEAQQVTVQIGQSEIRKARLLSGLGEIEERGMRVMSEIGKRLGIPAGTRWQAGPDGSVIIESSPQR